jgi:hypothetical protein
MLTLVPISPMTENHPHPSHYVASPAKSDSVIFAAVLRSHLAGEELTDLFLDGP